MDKKEQIRRGLKELLGNKAGSGSTTVLATVDAVNEDEFTCDIDDAGIKIYDVRLRPVLNEKEGITIFPKPGTWVLAVRIEDSQEWMVVAVDEVDKYRIVAGDMLFEMKEGKYLVQSGAENLGQCIDDLILQMQMIYAPKNTAAITAIQLRFKQLLSGA